MGGEERAHNVEGDQWFKSEADNNGFGVGNDGADVSSGTSEGFRTYKRRKNGRSSSESKGPEDGRGSVEAASKLVDETGKETWDHLPGNRVSLNGSNDVSPRQWRNFVLERLYQSLSDDEGGIRGCIRDALLMTAKESDTRNKDRHKSLQTVCRPNGTHYAGKGHADVVSKGAFDESHHVTATEMCRRAFLKIILSEKFTLLCKLLFENFQGMKTDNLLSLSIINKRMKEGAYERSPMLFSEDIQQLWGKLQGIGTELIYLAKSLSDVSMTCYNERVGGSGLCTSEDGKHEFCSRESDTHGKPEQTETWLVVGIDQCKRCGKRANPEMNYLVCDSCEEVYHLSCIEPPVKEIPSKSWYCASCTASGLGCSHKNCVVCERLNGCTPTKEEMLNEFEETSTFSMDDGVPLPKGKVCLCKLCGSLVQDGEKIKICDHSLCPYKYYHVRCLTAKQLQSYGPRWYCPSCLCRACLCDGDDDKIVLCDGCDQAYHLYCMNPARNAIPRGKWFCRQCDLKIKKIRRARMAYEKYEMRIKKQSEMGKRPNQNLKKKLKMQGKEESVNLKKKLKTQGKEASTNLKKKLNHEGDEELDKGRGGIDMLLNAALDYEA